MSTAPHNITAIEPRQSNNALAVRSAQEFGEEKIALIKRTIAKNATDDELEMFIAQCRRTGLDPFSKQIYAIKRWDQDEGREVMGIQVSIDGLRLIADRTDNYIPGREPTFTYNAAGDLETATAYVKRWAHGEWHEVAVSARYDEYVSKKKDGKPTYMWATKPHIMLAKCAESLALRKAFPNEMSGLYTSEETGSEAPLETDAGPVPPASAQARAAPSQPPPAFIETEEARSTFISLIKEHMARLGLSLEEQKQLVVAIADKPAKELNTTTLRIVAEQCGKFKNRQVVADFIDRRSSEKREGLKDRIFEDEENIRA